MTYTYEEVKTGRGKPRRFRLTHPMVDPALTEHPELKIPIRKVIEGAARFTMAKERFDMTQARDLHEL